MLKIEDLKIGMKVFYHYQDSTDLKNFIIQSIGIYESKICFSQGEDFYKGFKSSGKEGLFLYLGSYPRNDTKALFYDDEKEAKIAINKIIIKNSLESINSNRESIKNLQTEILKAQQNLENLTKINQ